MRIELNAIGDTMYRINQASNRISKVKKVSFSELNFTERHHLQEWLANEPDALEEDLLVIAKEFDGFDDTRERLDLLAIDKTGTLVVIENKLDDSGRDVMWQSLKYASYCSTLTRSNIAEIFQQFLDKDRANPGQDAKKLICDFLQEETFDDVKLNVGNDQRIIMVAANFRKEVTSTVMWLLKHRVYVKCFKATPFQDGKDLFLTVEQVIPLREAEELMIGISDKVDDEIKLDGRREKRNEFRVSFWHQVLEALRVSGVRRYDNVSPMRDNWLNARCGIRHLHYTMVFTRDEVRVEFGMSREVPEENKAIFDMLYAQKDAVETAFGAEFNWRRMPERRASLISYGKDFDGHNKECWPAMTQWIVEHMLRLQLAFEPRLPAIKELLASMTKAEPGTLTEPTSDAEA
ncbi:DUF4268 domain-containing protein [Variovorax sp. M-6]|uniref:DUF4268 domain-containing protein n=1 Tax=Variovorax sp. M-6 TaxID=3233041 RepID=UPI003F943581